MTGRWHRQCDAADDAPSPHLSCCLRERVDGSRGPYTLLRLRGDEVRKSVGAADPDCKRVVRARCSVSRRLRLLRSASAEWVLPASSPAAADIAQPSTTAATRTTGAGTSMASLCASAPNEPRTRCKPATGCTRLSLRLGGRGSGVDCAS